MPRNLILRILLIIVAAYHLSVGGLCMLGDDTILFLARTLGGIETAGQEQALILVHMFAPYLLAFGVCAAVAAWNPVRYRALISIIVVLFVLRAFQRVVIMDDVAKIFGSTPTRLWINTAVVAVLGAALLVFRLRLREKKPASE